MIKMNAKMEKMNDIIDENIKNTINENDKIQLKKTKHKLFQTLSLRNSLIPHYMTLDAQIILDIFKDKEKIKQF